VKIILLSFLLELSASAQAPSQSATTRYGKLPLSFEPNQGQTDAQIRFLSRGAGYTIFLSPTSATFALQHNADSAVVRMDLIGPMPASRCSRKTNYPASPTT
jgi:hypothetical protein